MAPSVRVNMAPWISKGRRNHDLLAVHVLQNIDRRALHHMRHPEEMAPANFVHVVLVLHGRILGRGLRRQDRGRNVLAVEMKLPKSREALRRSRRGAAAWCL